MRAPLLFLLAAASLAGCGSTQSASSQASSNSSTSKPAQNHVHSILVMPHNPQTLYMGGHYDLYRSVNGGRSWRALTNQMMLSLAMNPSNPSVLYAVSSKRGLQTSTNGGRSWTTVGGLPPGKIVGVTVDPATRGIFAYGTGIYRSTDGGHQWTRVLNVERVANIAVGGSGVAYASSDNGLYLSRTGGRSWMRVAALSSQPVLQVVAAKNVAYAAAAIALFKSTDNGHSWSALRRAPQPMDFLAVAPSDPNEVFGHVAGGGFVRSNDGGTNWMRAETGIHDTNFTASTIQVAPSSPHTVYTGSWGIDFYVSHDGGKHWTQTATLIH